jgi:PIN domain nuclease of toxin-antitoxin system
MRLLIDTQIFIWAVIDSDHLSEHARRILLDAADKQLAQYSELIMTVS